MLRAPTLLLAALAMTAAVPSYGQSGWKPDKSVELIVPSAAGGGLDRSARVVQRIWQENKLLPAPSAVINKPGGGGNIGYTYLSTFTGDAHYVSISSPTLLTNHIVGRNRFSHNDFTPLAHLSSEYLMVSVGPNSPIKSGSEIIERLKKDPASLSIAIGSVVGGSNHIGIGSVLKSAGIDIRKLRTVVFKSGSESVVAVMGGHVDLAVGAPEQALRLIQGGKVRAIAVAAPQRLPGALASVPTWKENGADVTAETWRGIVGPKGLTSEQVAFWDATLSKMVATAEWKKEAEKNLWDASYRNSAETRKFLDAEYRELKSVLLDIGLAK
jgi:putative tricarboxylic transport membrane protein